MKNEKPYYYFLISINIDFVFNQQTVILGLVSHRAKTGFGQVKIMKEFV